MKIRRIWSIEPLSTYGYYRVHATDCVLDIHYCNKIAIFSDFLAFERNMTLLSGQELSSRDYISLGLASAIEIADLYQRLESVNEVPIYSAQMPSLDEIKEWNEFDSFFAKNDAYFHYHDFIFHYVKNKKGVFRSSIGQYNKVETMSVGWQEHLASLQYLQKKLQDYPLVGSMGNAKEILMGLCREEYTSLKEYYEFNRHCDGLLNYHDFVSTRTMDTEESGLWL